MKRRTFLKGVAAFGGISFFSADALAAINEGTLDTIIIGATAEGCGIALRDPKRTLVIERGIHPAPEFLLSLDPEVPGVAMGDKSKAFEKLLKDNGLIENSKLYHQPVADMLTKFLVDNGVNMLFAVEFVDAKKTDSGYKVTVCGNDGKVSFAAKNIVDLRFSKVSAMSGVLLKKGSSDTRIFRVPIPGNSSPGQARLLFHAEWEKQQSAFPEWELVAEAGSLKYETGYPDFFAALDSRR